jgi:hypothetical protein
MTVVGLVASLTVAPMAGQRAPCRERTFKGERPWTAPRTPWGDPDIAGIFTNVYENGTPFERPDQFAGREFVTEEEFAQRLTQAQRQADADQEEFIAPRAGAGGAEGGSTGPPNHWLEHGKPSRRTSVIVAPADGRIPFLNDEARQQSKKEQKHAVPHQSSVSAFHAGSPLTCGRLPGKTIS